MPGAAPRRAFFSPAARNAAPRYFLIAGRPSWRQASFSSDQDTEVHLTFEPIGGETWLTVEHFGWDAIPPDHVARHHFPDDVFLRRHAEWWQALLSSYGDRAARGET